MHGEAQSTTLAVDGRVIVSLDGATKVFGGTVAIADVSFDLRAGEVLALLGENGAGKSTCVKLLAGVCQPTLGNVVVEGRIQHFASPQAAQHAGIAVMHQHPGLFPDLSIAENLFIGFEEGKAGWFVDAGRRTAKAKELVDLLGLDCDVSSPLSSLRTSEQQLVEIARALSRDARVIIMDEPTAALSQREVERLFAVVDDLRSRGVAMMFVGHRMDEIYRVADRIAVLRDGRLLATECAAHLSRDRAIQLMIGRPLDGLYPRHHKKPGAVVLSASKLGNGEVFQRVSFKLHAGEILGFGGLVGSGRTEIARVLFGIDQPSSGAININGKTVRFDSAKDAMANGVAYVSEDRIGQSLVMDFAIRTNASLTVLDRVTRNGMISSEKEIELAKPHLDRLRLRFNSYEQAVSTLSGGNQQKVVLSKWLSTRPRILVLDEPTQGIDVQTKADVHAMMSDLASQGMAIILISSELPELLGMCDRIIVLREGHVEAEFLHSEATQEKVITAAGLANGLVVSLGRVPAIVVTLGTMSIYRGLDSLWTGGKQISADQVPQEWLDMTGAKLFGIPTIVVIALFTLIAMGYALRSLAIGREFFAIGSNPSGARLIGISVERRILLAFAISGLLAGF